MAEMLFKRRYIRSYESQKHHSPRTLVEGSVSSTDISSYEVNQLRTQIQDMQLEIDILKDTINV